MKVIVAGSRNITNYNLLLQAIKESNFTISEVVSGNARGVDRLGERYSLENGLPCQTFPADWNKHGRAAGCIRNVEMAKYADALIALWDGKSSGTKHMIDSAKSYGLQVFVKKAVVSEDPVDIIFSCEN